MSGLNPEILAQMHAALDGELSESSHAELLALLEHDQAARQHYAELQKLEGALSSLPQLDAPSPLGSDITRALAQRARNSRRQFDLRSWFALPVMRYAMSFMLGVLAVGIVTQIYVTEEPTPQISGTMVPFDRFSTIESMQLQVETVRGEIALSRADELLRLDFDLDLEQSTDIVVTINGDAATLDGLARSGGELASLHAVGNRIKMQASGSQHFTLQFRSAGNEAETIDLEFVRAGQLLASTTLRAKTESM